MPVVLHYVSTMRHVLDEGRDVLTVLERLGRALGYEVSQEHRVGRSAAVDLSWTAASYNDVPLFIFEVESSASAGLASNAMKIYGSPLEELPKPLFFFHLVLTGQPDNERIRNAERAWGQHNYRVYRFRSEDERLRLVLDIVRQHRRLNRRVRPAAIGDALIDAGWGDLLIEAVCDELERLRFDAPFLHDYASLALADRRHLPMYVRRLRRLEQPETVTSFTYDLKEEGYMRGPGDYIGGLLEGALRIFAGDIQDADGPAHLEAWATSAPIELRMMDANFGLSLDYDNFMLFRAPMQYALAATLLRQHPASRAWVIEDMMRVLIRVREHWQLDRRSWPTMIWLAHLLAAPLDPTLGTFDVQTHYKRLAELVDEVGGVPISLLRDPPPPWGDITDPDSLDWLNPTDVSRLPGRTELQSLTAGRTGSAPTSVGHVGVDVCGWCLEALIYDEAYVRPTQRLVAAIHGLA